MEFSVFAVVFDIVAVRGRDATSPLSAYTFISIYDDDVELGS